MKKYASILTVTLLALALTLTACGPKTDASTPVAGGQPVETQPTPIPPTPSGVEQIDRFLSLDPANPEPTAAAVSANLYEGLVAADGSGALAVNWQVSEDGLEYSMVLRQGVAFSDGTPFNADAVLDNFNRWFDTTSPLHGSGEYAAWLQYFLAFKDEKDTNGVPVSFFDGVEKVDEFTVLFHLNRPEPTFIELLAKPEFAMVSPTALAAAGESYGTSAATVAGSGPFFIKEWTETGMTLVPNNSYWGNIPVVSLQYEFK